jgi:hypothetical protein
MQLRVRRAAHLLERSGLAMAGAACGLFVATHNVRGQIASISQTKRPPEGGLSAALIEAENQATRTPPPADLVTQPLGPIYTVRVRSVSQKATPWAKLNERCPHDTQDKRHALPSFRIEAHEGRMTGGCAHAACGIRATRPASTIAIQAMMELVPFGALDRAADHSVLRKDRLF